MRRNHRLAHCGCQEYRCMNHLLASPFRFAWAGPPVQPLEVATTRPSSYLCSRGDAWGGPGWSRLAHAAVSVARGASPKLGAPGETEYWTQGSVTAGFRGARGTLCVGWPGGATFRDMWSVILCPRRPLGRLPFLERHGVRTHWLA